MKQFATLFLLFFACSMHAQTIFVKANALGANNGTSWADAYISLDAALTVALPGQAIWVSAGTYKPATSFLVQTGLSLYGGFSGTETALDQRNPLVNLTVLSGDLLGNDLAGNFTLNRTDNAQHIVTIFSNISTDPALIDGFVLRGGHTLTGNANPDLTRRGGGILAGAKATVRNCHFTDNYGESGAGMAAIGTASDGTVVDNCTFEANRATEQGVLMLRQTPTGSVNKCVFRNNLVNRGAFYPQETVNVTIDSCLFEGNNAGMNFGSAMFSWQASWTLTNSIFRKNKSANAGIYIDNRDGGDVVTVDNCLFERDTATGFGGAGLYGWQATAVVKNCTFRDNYAPSAAAVYFNGREYDSQFSIDSCLFEGNIATDYGGTALYNNRTNYTLSNSIFRDNVAPSSAAAIYHGDTTIFYVTNCLFEANKGNYAAAVANYGIGCKGTFDGCTFQGNRANQGGGAVSNGFKADVAFKDCYFDGNEASFGGAIFTQNDTTRLQIDGCLFAGNNASGNGAAVYINQNIAASIRNSEFVYNTGDFGGAIQAIGDSLLTIENTIFRNNFAGSQGAALNFLQTKAVLTNCLFAKNINVGDGAGGAISINASDSLNSRVKMVNCTFADNEAVIGAGIAQWEAPAGDAQLTLLNCLFQNPNGENYSIEEGEPEVFSLNGNQSSDASLEADLLASKDVHNLTTTFFDPANDDYHLTMGPAVDGGVAEGAPVTDLSGSPRLGLPDRGCYELGINGVQNVGFQVLPMQCFPNPAAEKTMLKLQSERNGQAEILVWNQAGQRVQSFQVEKTSPEFEYSLVLEQWPSGTYRVQFRLGVLVYEGSFIKI